MSDLVERLMLLSVAMFAAAWLLDQACLLLEPHVGLLASVVLMVFWIRFWLHRRGW